MNALEQLREYERYLWLAEKSRSTIKKYSRNVRRFLEFVGEREITKEVVLEYKNSLKDDHKATGINTILAAVNGFLKFCEMPDCCVLNERVQRQIFVSEDKELTQSEYQRLLRAGYKTRIFFIMKCLAETGIRVSELPFITVEALKKGMAIVNCKNKTRVVFLPKSLCKHLKDYARNNGIRSGCIFVTVNGNPIYRTTVWSEMKALCEAAHVSPSKVYPHNLRHLFAKTYYQMEKDIVKLADILGHSSIQTTRIYTMSSGQEHRKGLERVAELMNQVDEMFEKVQNTDSVPSIHQ